MLLVWLAAAGAAAAAPPAAKLYKEGLRAEQAGKMARAYLLYTQAAALDPSNQMYWLRSQAVRTRAALEARPLPKPVAGEPQPDLLVQLPGPEPAPIPEATAEDLAEAAKPLPPRKLSGTAGQRDFDLRGDSKQLFEEVAKAFGLDCVFDAEYQPTQPIRFRMQQADYRQALHALEAATSSFVVPITEKVFLVAKDTPQKRAEVEPSVAMTIRLPEPTSTQDLTELITAVRQTLGIQRVTWDTQRNIVVLRDAISKVLPARALFEGLMHPRAQVMVDVQFLELSRSVVTSYGLALPDSFPLVPLTRALGNIPKIPPGISRLAVFGGGKTLMGLGIADPSLIARMTRSGGNVLLKAELRSIDGQTATFHVGDRFPVLTGGYFGPEDASGPDAYRPPPSFTFEDLGLSVKVTPKVHGTEAVTLELETEFKLLTGKVVNFIPVISNRKLTSVVRLETGEWAVVGGLMETTEARTIAGLAGLSSLPALGPLFSQRNLTRDNREVLLLLRPRLVTAPPDQVAVKALRIGSETRPLTPL